ncbi:MAG: molybdopterin cofactor-binding domain-containing protein, partial [Terriglobales bacterium]
GTDKGGRVATCAEIVVRGGQIELRRIVSAWESGAVVDPDNLRNQITGAAILGLGGALFEQVTFADGQVRSDRFSRYPVPRMSGLPKIEAVLVNRPDLPPAGAGEIPIVGVAPALANAIFDATGERRRHMPLADATLAPA